MMIVTVLTDKVNQVECPIPLAFAEELIESNNLSETILEGAGSADPLA